MPRYTEGYFPHFTKQLNAKMMDGMMNGDAMMWGMGLIGLLVLILLVLGIGALVKYLFKK